LYTHAFLLLQSVLYGYISKSPEKPGAEDC
jgi:hypothetical protein